MLPELADRRVLTDPTGPLDQPTVPAERAITLRDLLTFRCGLPLRAAHKVVHSETLAAPSTTNTGLVDEVVL